MIQMDVKAYREYIAKHHGGAKKAKYGNTKTVAEGHTFDSKVEAERYLHLRDWEKRGIISDLRCQVKFELIPSQIKSDGKRERSCVYIADFTFIKNGVLFVEDKKGFRTKDYIIKRKLMLFIHNISVIEV